MREIIKQFKGLFNEPAPQKQESPKLRTVQPNNRPTFDAWCKEFRVSMLHGRISSHFG